MKHVSVTEFVRAFAEYINRVAYRGESFVLVRGRKELAEVRPAIHGRRVSDLPAALAALPKLDPGDAEVWRAQLGVARANFTADRDAWVS